MPFDYFIDKKRRLVVSTGTGVVTGAEIKAHQNRLLADPQFDSAFHQLIDLTRAAELTATVAEISSCAKRSVFSRDSKRAWVAAIPAIYGMGRLAVAHHEMSEVPSHAAAFQDIPSAMKWLGLDEPFLQQDH